MLDPKLFVEQISDASCSGIFGVPDSLLADVGLELASLSSMPNITACNEGSAVAMAIGSYLATGLPAMVYMQNSGLGNAINPLLSLADRSVYGIPMVLMIGWRGKPGQADEPQHLKQGAITEDLLRDMGIPCVVLPTEQFLSHEILRSAFDESVKTNGPVAILVSKGTFQASSLRLNQSSEDTQKLLSREDALQVVYSQISTDATVVSTTGMLSRELEELQSKSASQDHPRTLFVIGGMGHASSIALGISSSKPAGAVWCLDGDGSMLMHLGSLPVIASAKPGNFLHILFDNESHDSVGGQQTPLDLADLSRIAVSSGYSYSAVVDSKKDILNELIFMRSITGPRLLQIKIKKGSRPDLGRPKKSPSQMKESLRISFDADV